MATATHVYGQAQLKIPDGDTHALVRTEHLVDDLKRKTKIICTMGPSCWDVPVLVQMIDAGMNIARLNFSHGDHEAHGATVDRIREACKQRPDKPVAIALDTKGPEIRTGFFKEECNGKVTLKNGQDLKLVTDYSFKGDNTCFALTYDKLPTSVQVGSLILLADGSLSLTVTEVGADFVNTKVMNDCTLGERKNCNLPGVKVDLPVLQEKDIKDLVEFGIPRGVDMIFASFVQSAADVKMIRDTLGLRGRSVHIVSKIENEEGLKNIDEIVVASDAVMVARGDLGMEIPTEKVFLAQKMIIAKCNLIGKPVITATQMLESMTSAPRPTRAEASDVSNAILDGSDCVMLSGETAGGKYPLNAVTIMRKICQECEAVVDYETLCLSLRQQAMEKFGDAPVPSVQSVCSAAVTCSIESKCSLIVALTETGHTARMIAKYRPSCPILAISASETTVRQLQLVRGVVATLTASFQGTDSVLQKAIARAKEDGLVKKGDMVVAIHGQKEEMPGESNLLKIVQVQ